MLVSDREQIGIALGRVPSGCAILTVEHQARSTGVLVSWIQQASFEPLMVSTAIKRGRPVQSLLDASGRYLLNLLGENPTSLFRHFGRGFTLAEDAFAGLQTQPTSFGRLLPECIAALGCEIRSKMEAGDHDLYVSEVVAAHVAQRLNPYVHVRGSALTY